MLNEDKKKLFLSWNDDYLTFRRITATFVFDVVTQTETSERKSFGCSALFQLD